MVGDTEKTEVPPKEPAINPEQNPSAKQPEEQSEFQQAAQGIQELLTTMPKGGTPKQRMTYWLIGLIVTTVATLAYPLGTAFSSYADKRAERETATMKQQADADASKARMQADLLKRIIAVADKATLKDPTSIFQLGLIAQMVNENEAAFGIKLVDAERTMKRMFDSLAPVSGLRRRLAESNRLLRRINRKVSRADRGVKRADKAIGELRRKQTAARTKWQRQHFQRAMQEQQHYRDHHDLQHQFYQLKAKREKQLQQYFQGELEMQEATLTRRLQQTTLLRSKMKDRTERFRYLLTKLRTRSKVTQQVAAELRNVMAEVESSTETAQQDIKRLKSELESERNALDTAKRTLNRARQKLRWYRQNQRLNITVGPMPPFYWPVCTAAVVNTPAKSKRRRYSPKRRPLGGAAYYRPPRPRASTVTVIRRAASMMAPRRASPRRFRRRKTLQGLFGPE